MLSTAEDLFFKKKHFFEVKNKENMGYWDV